MAERRAFVIGGSSGIGAAVVRRLRDEDVEVEAPTKQHCDMRTYNIEWCIKSDGRTYDYYVYSAGVNFLEWIPGMRIAIAQNTFDVNVIGFMRMLSWITRDPCEPARVVAISSDAATRPMRTSMAYCASKAALDMAVKCAARELGPAGWRINAVSPGMTSNTQMTKYIDKTVPEIRGWTEEEALEYEMSQQPLGRRATPDEIADVVWATLVGPDFLNGSVITVNGGR